MTQAQLASYHHSLSILCIKNVFLRLIITELFCILHFSVPNYDVSCDTTYPATPHLSVGSTKPSNYLKLLTPFFLICSYSQKL